MVKGKKSLQNHILTKIDVEVLSLQKKNRIQKKNACRPLTRWFFFFQFSTLLETISGFPAPLSFRRANKVEKTLKQRKKTGKEKKAI